MVNTFNKEGTLLEGTVSFPIYYEDTDLSGFVYHSNYMKFFERAREHLLGIERLKEFRKKGLHFVVTHMDIKFFKPAQHGDVLVIKSHGHIGRSPLIVFDQRAYLDKAEMVTATIKVAAVNRNFRPIRIPQEFLENF